MRKRCAKHGSGCRSVRCLIEIAAASQHSAFGFPGKMQVAGLCHHVARRGQMRPMGPHLRGVEIECLDCRPVGLAAAAPSAVATRRRLCCARPCLPSLRALQSSTCCRQSTEGWAQKINDPHHEPCGFREPSTRPRPGGTAAAQREAFRSVTRTNRSNARFLGRFVAQGWRNPAQADFQKTHGK